MLSRVEREKSLITLGPGLSGACLSRLKLINQACLNINIGESFQDYS